MSKGGKEVPVGLRKPSKGGHSEKTASHKAPWFQSTKPDGNPGQKSQRPYIVPCISQQEKWMFNSITGMWEIKEKNYAGF